MPKTEGVLQSLGHFKKFVANYHLSLIFVYDVALAQSSPVDLSPMYTLSDRLFLLGGRPLLVSGIIQCVLFSASSRPVSFLDPLQYFPIPK